jgi:hypothetical protein
VKDLLRQLDIQILKFVQQSGGDELRAYAVMLQQRKQLFKVFVIVDNIRQSAHIAALLL